MDLLKKSMYKWSHTTMHLNSCNPHDPMKQFNYSLGFRDVETDHKVFK